MGFFSKVLFIPLLSLHKSEAKHGESWYSNVDLAQSVQFHIWCTYCTIYNYLYKQLFISPYIYCIIHYLHDVIHTLLTFCCAVVT